MGITTSASLLQPKQSVCANCGWGAALLLLDSNGRKVHESACPDGPPPDPEYVAVAHDAMSDQPGADLRALRALKDHGVGLFGAGLTRTNPVTGDVFPRIDLDRAEKAATPRPNAPAMPVPRWMEEDAFAADRSQSKPLGAGRRKRETT